MRSVLLVLLLLAFPASAQAIRVAGLPLEIATPADQLVHVAVDPEEYDPATRCTTAPKPGMTSLVAWLGRNSRGTSWGTFRCERWGDGEASLHAEGRAVDWHLDSRDPAQRADGKRLIALLLAPDAAGNAHALARRMGVQELIWDCSYWSAGQADFSPYRPCFNRDGERRRRVGATLGHLDHVHIGLSKAGAAKRTTWWLRR